jgi:hypothetical protein
MRRTMSVPVELAGVVQLPHRVARIGERPRLVKMIGDAGIATDAERWLTGSRPRRSRRSIDSARRPQPT